MNLFDEQIQLEEGIHISDNGKAIPLRKFFQDKNKDTPLYNCESIEELLKIITQDTDFATFDTCDLYLPVNKKTMPARRVASLIFEGVIDLTTMEGRKEARRRFALLAHLLLSQPNRNDDEKIILHSGGAGITIGNFEFPDRSTNRAVVFWKSDHGHNGCWWFNVLPTHGLNVDPGYWFAFSDKLKELINSSDTIPS